MSNNNENTTPSTSFLIIIIGMAVICLTGFIFVIFGSNEPSISDERYYINQSGVIVSMGSEDGETNDKFHRPTVFHTILIQHAQDSTLFVEWSVSKEKYYNYHVGDSVKFDYIQKAHWFHINKK
jgi:hypothetical protein